MSSITAVNAVLMLAITDLFDTPQQLQQFSADDIYGMDAATVAETAMGVDGFLTGGLVYNPRVQHITLQADSPSNAVFDTWNQQQLQAQDLFYANMVVTLKSLGTKWTHTKGILTTFQPLPAAQKILRPRAYTITWERLTPSPA